MRVLYLTMNRYPASTTVSLEGWIRVLRPRGLQPVVVSGRSTAGRWTKNHGIPAYDVPLPWPSKSKPWRFLRSLWVLGALIRRHDIRIVHCNEEFIYPIAQYLARLHRLPVVVSVHSRLDPQFCRWAFRGSRRPCRILFSSEASLESCRSTVEGLIPETDWRVLPNALDLERYGANATERDRFRKGYGLSSELTIGAASALRPGKQLEQLMEAAAALSSPNVHVLLAGAPSAGFDSYAADVLELGRRMLGDRFRYLGYLDDLRGFMNALDLYVNTSKEEAFGISVLEALACGCPVVGYPSVAVADIVLPSGGQIVPQDTVDELTIALDGWLCDPSRLAAGRVGARRAAERYDIKRAADQLWVEYLDVLG